MKLPIIKRAALLLVAQVAALMLMACYLVQALQPDGVTPSAPVPLAQVVDLPTAVLPSPTNVPTETLPEPPTPTASSPPTIADPTATPIVPTPTLTASAIPMTPTSSPTPSDHILWSDASEYLGEERTVCGPVAGTHYAKESRGKPTFLNIGEDYPSPDRFVVLIWVEYRDNFSNKPEDYYDGKTICAQGEILEYEGIFEIEVQSPSDIEVQQ